MKRWQKLALGIFSILVMLNAFYGISQFQYTVGSPFSDIALDSEKLQFYVALIFFWLSVSLFISASLIFLTSIFFPKKRKALQLSSKANLNSLAIQNRAIESLILIKAKEKNFLDEVSSKVVVKARKKKMVGKIYSRVTLEPALPEKSRLFLEELHEDIEQMLDLKSESIKLKLVFRRIKDKKMKNKESSRVL